VNHVPSGRSLGRWAAGVGIALGCGLGLAACGDGGNASARQACAHVKTSLTLYAQSTRTADPTRAARLAEQAEIQLTEAEPLAADAADEDTQWQALMTTLSEYGRVSESHLVAALTDQCAAADSTVGGGPPPPSSIPPPATTPPTS
jgi:hypothetical protein